MLLTVPIPERWSLALRRSGREGCVSAGRKTERDVYVAIVQLPRQSND